MKENIQEDNAQDEISKLQLTRCLRNKGSVKLQKIALVQLAFDVLQCQKKIYDMGFYINYSSWYPASISI